MRIHRTGYCDVMIYFATLKSLHPDFLFLFQSKGKQRTKGQKQIIEENASTLQFYLYIAGGATVRSHVVNSFVIWNTFAWFRVTTVLISCQKFANLTMFRTD